MAGKYIGEPVAMAAAERGNIAGYFKVISANLKLILRCVEVADLKP